MRARAAVVHCRRGEALAHLAGAEQPHGAVQRLHWTLHRTREGAACSAHVANLARQEVSDLVGGGNRGRWSGGAVGRWVCIVLCYIMRCVLCGVMMAWCYGRMVAWSHRGIVLVVASWYGRMVARWHGRKVVVVASWHRGMVSCTDLIVVDLNVLRRQLGGHRGGRELARLL